MTAGLFYKANTELKTGTQDSRHKSKKAAVGVEPTNNGFANRRLRPLGYAATAKNIHKFTLDCPALQ
jgi:hypothetical protein